MGRRLDLALSILNGAVGQYLAQTDNGLATPTALYASGHPLVLEPSSLRAQLPTAGRSLVVLVHGLMATERSWAFPDDSDYGTMLERDVGLTPLYVRYNTGRAISDNGSALASLLEQLFVAYPQPVEEIVLVGHSMGGLVIRSACHVASEAGHAWLTKVRRAIYVGTPHVGAPLERVGKVVTKVLASINDPYTRLIADIARFRSDGIKDLGHGDLGLRDAAHPVPLLDGIRHCLIAGSVSEQRLWTSLFGDAMVSVASATYGARAIDQVHLVLGVGHVALAHHADVYREILAFCRQPSR